MPGDDSRAGWLSSGLSCSCHVALNKPLPSLGYLKGGPEILTFPWNPPGVVVFTTIPPESVPGSWNSFKPRDIPEKTGRFVIPISEMRKQTQAKEGA